MPEPYIKIQEMPAPRGSNNPGVINRLNAHAPARAVVQTIGLGKYLASAELCLRQVTLTAPCSSSSSPYETMCPPPPRHMHTVLRGMRSSCT